MNVHLLVSNMLLWLLRKTYPGKKPTGAVWQIIEVPRRISTTEAEQLAEQVNNL